ncbi:MAG: lysophospholipid acyltransferase family protein [Candidatus Hermodarchaeota archaeon]
MSENMVVPEENEKPKLNKNQLMEDVLYSLTKGVGGEILKNFAGLKIEGEEKIPYRGKAILTTISKNALRDMLIISQLTGRKVHFMVSPKLMKHQIAGPLLKSIGMIRGTENKDDTEPIDKVFEILNVKGDLVGMTPSAKHDRDIQVKSVAGIIKFAVAANTPIIPLAIFTEKTKLFNLIPIDGIKVKVGDPISVSKNLNREKYRDQRYELAEDIVNIIDSLRYVPDQEGI